jgi:hypothetical protein
MSTKATVDFTVQYEGSIVLLRPHTDIARSWIDENIGKANGHQPYWPCVVIEYRYVDDILDGIASDGLEAR